MKNGHDIYITSDVGFYDEYDYESWPYWLCELEGKCGLCV